MPRCFVPYVPTEDQRRQVQTMAGFGITQAEISKLMVCDLKTLRKHYRRELDIGAATTNLAVVQSLYNNAVKNDNVAAQIWWTKARMGWKSETDLNVSGTQTIQLQHLMAARAFSEALNAGTLPALAHEADDAPEIDGDTAEADDLMQPATE